MNTVLLVDDEHIELEYLNYILKKYPNKYKVVAMANSGKDAISYNSILKPDLAIVDISMPFINGIETARKMLHDNISLEIIINSAYREFDYAVDAMQMGIHTYLIKPSSEQTILKALDDAAKRKSTRIKRLPVKELSKRYTLYDRLTSYINALLMKDHKSTEANKETIKEFILMANAALSSSNGYSFCRTRYSSDIIETKTIF